MQSSAHQLEFIVAPGDAGARLDRYLAARLPELSRSRIQALMDQGRVMVARVVRKPSYRVGAGETVCVEIPAPAPSEVLPEPIPLEVLYEDDDVAVIAKPAGMIVHPGAGRDSGTLAAALIHRFGGISHLSDIGGALRPGIVHRLDKGTSGVLLVAKTNPAHLRLAKQFSERQVRKIYLALLHGDLKENSGRIELPVARDLHHPVRMTARRREGRSARTDWQVRLRIPGFTLVTAILHTGRTHQLRVHFSALGHPVVGDTLYGAPRQPRAGGGLLPPLGRNFLHAAQIGFFQPHSGQPVEVHVPVPPELLEYLRQIAQASGVGNDRIDVALREFL